MRRDMSQVDTSMDTSRWAWPSWLKAAAHTQFWRSVLQANWWSYCPLQISVTAGLRSHTPHAYSAPGFSCHRGLLQPVSDTSQPAPGHLSWWSGPSRLAKGLSITAQEGSHWGICLELEQKWWSCFAMEMKNSSLVTVSGSSHASLIVAYEAVCWAFLGVARKDETYFLMLGHICWALSATTTSSTHLWGQNFRGNTVDPVSLTKSSRRTGVSWNSCYNDRMSQPDSFTPFWRPPWTTWSPQLPIFRSCGSSSELRSFGRSV